MPTARRDKHGESRVNPIIVASSRAEDARRPVTHDPHNLVANYFTHRSSARQAACSHRLGTMPHSPLPPPPLRRNSRFLFFSQGSWAAARPTRPWRRDYARGVQYHPRFAQGLLEVVSFVVSCAVVERSSIMPSERLATRFSLPLRENVWIDSCVYTGRRCGREGIV